MTAPYSHLNATSVGCRLNPPSQADVHEGHYRTQRGVVISLQDVDAVRLEVNRLDDWRKRWLNLASDHDRIRKMGNLQTQIDYIIGRSLRAARTHGLLLKAFWKYADEQIVRKGQEKYDPEAEAAAWQAKFPAFIYDAKLKCIIAASASPTTSLH